MYGFSRHPDANLTAGYPATEAQGDRAIRLCVRKRVPLHGSHRGGILPQRSLRVNWRNYFELPSVGLLGTSVYVGIRETSVTLFPAGKSDVAVRVDSVTSRPAPINVQVSCT